MLSKIARLCIGSLQIGIGFLAIPVAYVFLRPHRDPIAQAVGQMLMIGFYGSTKWSLSARLLAAQVRRGQVGGVFFVLQNVGSRKKAKDLVSLFRAANARLFIAIDHEGGVVQRLTQTHGFTTLPSARVVAQALVPEKAQELYTQAGRELASFGFNVNLAPVVDVDDPNCPAIGKHGRAFAQDAATIVPYAAAFVEGFRRNGVLCAIKHFPGHGRATQDSHDGTADLTGLWSPLDMLPFQRMIESGQAQMIMGGHLRLAELDPSLVPTTISRRVTTDILRDQLNFEGVVMTDDLDMGALSGLMGRRKAVIRAIAAGNDILLVKNLFGYDPLLPWRIVRWVKQSITSGTISRHQILASAERIASLRSTLH